MSEPEDMPYSMSGRELVAESSGLPVEFLIHDKGNDGR